MNDAQLEKLWIQFGDTPINDSDEIEESFLEWGVGTDRFIIWHWFDDSHSKGVQYLLTKGKRQLI